MVTPRPELWRRRRGEARLMAPGPTRGPRGGGVGGEGEVVEEGTAGPGVGAPQQVGGAPYGLGPEAGADAEGGARVERGPDDGGGGGLPVAHALGAHDGADG